MQIVGLALIASGIGAAVLILALTMMRRARQRQPAAAGAGRVSVPPHGVAEKREEATLAFSRKTAGGEDATAVYSGNATGKLVCSEGPLRGKQFPVGTGTAIGRDSKRSQIVIQDSEVSGQHVWIGTVGGKVVARDCGSTNGTFLNGDMSRRISEVPLSDGDVLTLGGRGAVKFTYRASP
jgi:hypothetical protein